VACHHHRTQPRIVESDGCGGRAVQRSRQSSGIISSANDEIVLVALEERAEEAAFMPQEIMQRTRTDLQETGLMIGLWKSSSLKSIASVSVKEAQLLIPAYALSTRNNFVYH
jgi:hypothetical protein